MFDQALGDADDELRRQFEAVLQFDSEDRQTAQGVLEALILRHQNKRFFIKPTSAAATKTGSKSPDAAATGARSKAAKARVRGSATRSARPE